MPPQVTQQHDAVRGAIDAYNVAPSAARQRQLIAGLRAAGFALAGAPELDDAAWAAAHPHTLLVYASDYENAYWAWMIPDDHISAQADDDLDVLHGKAVVHGDTCLHADAQWQAWVRIALRTACKTVDDFETDVEMRADEDLGGTPDVPDAELDRWVHDQASEAGELIGARFGGRITRIVLVRENT